MERRQLARERNKRKANWRLIVIDCDGPLFGLWDGSVPFSLHHDVPRVRSSSSSTLFSHTICPPSSIPYIVPLKPAASHRVDDMISIISSISSSSSSFETTTRCWPRENESGASLDRDSCQLQKKRTAHTEINRIKPRWFHWDYYNM